MSGWLRQRVEKFPRLVRFDLQTQLGALAGQSRVLPGFRILRGRGYRLMLECRPSERVLRVVEARDERDA